LADTDYDPVVHYSTIDELNQKLGQALAKSLEWGNKIPTGVFYKNELITPYTKRITDKIPNYLENPAAQQKISKNGKSTTDISKLLDSLLV
jgi:2-oxoglutarate ferredoxin oxidoreductase subunit beta